MAPNQHQHSPSPGDSSKRDVKSLAGRLLGSFKGDHDRAAILRASIVVGMIRSSGGVLIYLSYLFLARWIGATEFGIYSYALSWASLLTIPVGLGLISACLRFVPEYQAHKESPKLFGYVRLSWSAVILTAIAIGSLAAILVLIFSDYVPDFYVKPLYVAFMYIFPLSILSLHMEMGRAFGWPVLAYAPKQLAAPVFLVIGAGLLLFFGRSLSAVDVLGVAFSSSLIIILFQGKMIWGRLMRTLKGVQPVYETRLWLRVAFPLLLATSFHGAITQTDIIMVGLFLTPEQVAVYFSAIKTGTLIAFVLAAVNALTAPKIAALHSQGRHEELQALLSSVIHWIFWPALMTALVMVIFGGQILTLFGPGFAAGYTALIILACGQLVKAGAGPVSDLLSLTGHHDLNARVMGYCVAINVILNALLIPQFGIVGAATATAVTMIVWNIWLWRLAKRLLNIDPTIFAGFGKR